MAIVFNQAVVNSIKFDFTYSNPLIGLDIQRPFWVIREARLHFFCAFTKRMEG